MADDRPAVVEKLCNIAHHGADEDRPAYNPNSGRIEFAVVRGVPGHTPAGEPCFIIFRRPKCPLNARLTGPYNCFDPYWHPFYHGRDMHSMQSVSKTVTSVIYGIAMTRGDFKAGLDTPVLKFFDEARVKNVNERKRRMTIKNVLTMTTGLEWNEEVPYDDPLRFKSHGGN